MDPTKAWQRLSIQWGDGFGPTNWWTDTCVTTLVKVTPLRFDRVNQWFGGSMGWRFEGPGSRGFAVVRIGKDEMLYAELPRWTTDLLTQELDIEQHSDSGNLMHSSFVLGLQLHQEMTRLHGRGRKKWISELLPRR